MWLLHHSEMLLLLDIIPDPYKVRYISIHSWTLVPCFLFQLTSMLWLSPSTPPPHHEAALWPEHT